MRPVADILAEVREAARHRPSRGPAARTDRQSLPGAGRPGVRLRGAARAGQRGATASTASASRARIRATSRRGSSRRSAICRRSASTSTCRCSPARTGSCARCGAATRARRISISSTRLRAAVPGVALSTDMIVGFPGETDEDFEQTLDLVRRARYHSMYSFKYSPRPNTLAIKRLPDDVPEAEKTRRILALQDLQREIQGERLRGDGRARRTRSSSTASSRRRAWELTGRTSGQHRRELPGTAGVARPARAGAHHRGGAQQPARRGASRRPRSRPGRPPC